MWKYFTFWGRQFFACHVIIKVFFCHDIWSGTKEQHTSRFPIREVAAASQPAVWSGICILETDTKISFSLFLLGLLRLFFLSSLPHPFLSPPHERPKNKGFRRPYFTTRVRNRPRYPVFWPKCIKIIRKAVSKPDILFLSLVTKKRLIWNRFFLSKT